MVFIHLILHTVLGKSGTKKALKTSVIPGKAVAKEALKPNIIPNWNWR
jgi:hypothetical protein